MNPADVLDRAAELIEEQGWCQFTHQDGEGRLCMWGAVNEACKEQADFEILTVPQQWRRRDTVSDLITKDLRESGDLVLTEGYPIWNDMPGRTKAEVQQRLRTIAFKCRTSGT